MKGFKIVERDYMGFEGEEMYTINYGKAIQEFNNLIRKTMKEVYEPIDKKDFSKKVNEFKDNVFNHVELIFRRCPVIMYKDSNGDLVGAVYSWNEPNYEHSEQDIISEQIRLTEIDILD